MERIPIMIDGAVCGQLQLWREGAYMVCSGQARWQGEMQRLWLYGSGAPAYLGVLLPDGQGGGTVRKKFSLADFARLPLPLRCCGPEEQPMPQSDQSQEEADMLWVRRADGTLLRSDGQRQYIAFPTDRIRLPRGTEFLLRKIEGREYVIFPY